MLLLLLGTCPFTTNALSALPSCAAGDRLASLVILGSLVLLDTDERHRQLFGGMLALDISKYLFRLYVFWERKRSSTFCV